MIYEYDFLDRNSLRQITSLFDAGKFIDGAITGPKEKHVKNNTQQDDVEINNIVNQSITKILKQTELFRLHPLNKCSPCFMLKYEEGQHYDDHTDYYEMWGCRTDYTVVITLNDDYEGGEHFIKIGTETIEKKLPAGKALIYPTEFIHGVRPVTSGVRKCLTFWLESSISDPTMRYYITELNKVYWEVEGYLDRKVLTQFDLARLGILRHHAILRN